jgi:hypothetical protein
MRSLGVESESMKMDLEREVEGDVRRRTQPKFQEGSRSETAGSLFCMRGGCRVDTSIVSVHFGATPRAVAMFEVVRSTGSEVTFLIQRCRAILTDNCRGKWQHSLSLALVASHGGVCTRSRNVCRLTALTVLHHARFRMPCIALRTSSSTELDVSRSAALYVAFQSYYFWWPAGGQYLRNSVSERSNFHQNQKEFAVPGDLSPR